MSFHLFPEVKGSACVGCAISEWICFSPHERQCYLPWGEKKLNLDTALFSWTKIGFIAHHSKQLYSMTNWPKPCSPLHIRQLFPIHSNIMWTIFPICSETVMSLSMVLVAFPSEQVMLTACKVCYINIAMTLKTHKIIITQRRINLPVPCIHVSTDFSHFFVVNIKLKFSSGQKATSTSEPDVRLRVHEVRWAEGHYRTVYR